MAKTKTDSAPEAETTESTSAGPYREVEGFKDGLKSAVAVAKENADLKAILQLIRHLSWGTPRSTVSWAAGTTETVVTTAKDLTIADGTPLPEALGIAIKAATSAAKEKAEKDAVAVLAKLVKSNG